MRVCVCPLFMDDADDAERGWWSESPSDASESSSDDDNELGDGLDPAAAAAADAAAEGAAAPAPGGASFRTLMLQRRGVQRLVKMVRAKRESWRPSWHAHYLRIHA